MSQKYTTSPAFADNNWNESVEQEHCK